MKPTKAMRVATVAGAGALLALTVGGTAHAQAAPSAAASKAVVQDDGAAMYVAGFDAAVAKAHGYVVRKDAAGHEYSVQAGALNNAVVVPANTVGGNCGTSSLYWGATSGHAADIITGFNLTSPAIQFSWTVHVIDKYGVSDKHWGGPLANKTGWAGSNHFVSSGPGSISAVVSAGSAVLSSGSVCVSGHPSATTVVA